MTFSSQVKIDELINAQKTAEIVILDDNEVEIGTMRPLTKLDLKDNEIIECLTRWRNQNMHSFLTQFVATNERTINWLENVVFKSEGQMLFIIHNGEKVVGHLGFKNLIDKEAMLDNSIRGERGGHPKLFVQAHKALITWMIKSLGIESIIGIVLADNASGLMTNKLVGYKTRILLPLIQEYNSDGSTIWRLGAEGQESPQDKYCYKLKIR